MMMMMMMKGNVNVFLIKKKLKMFQFLQAPNRTPHAHWKEHIVKQNIARKVGDDDDNDIKYTQKKVDGNDSLCPCTK